MAGGRLLLARHFIEFQHGVRGRPLGRAGQAGNYFGKAGYSPNGACWFPTTHTHTNIYQSIYLGIYLLSIYLSIYL